MKAAIFFTLLLVTTHSMAAGNEPKLCSINSVLAQQDVSDTASATGGVQQCEAMGAVEKKAFSEFTNALCSSIKINQDPDRYTDQIFSSYFNKLGKQESSNQIEKTKNRLAFLNQNKNNIIFKEQDYPKTKSFICESGLQYMKYAQYRKTHKMFFYEFLLNGLIPEDRSMWIDINAVTLDENGEFETVIDFMMKESKIAEEKGFNDYKMEVERLIQIFKGRPFYGRPFNELPQSERGKYKQ